MGGANTKALSSAEILAKNQEAIKGIIKNATEYPNGMDCATLEEARSQLAKTRRVFLEIAKQGTKRSDTANSKKSEGHGLYALLAKFRENNGTVPPKMWLQHATASKEALAPAVVSAALNQEALDRAQEMATSVTEEPTLSQSIFVAKKHAKQQTKFDRIAHDSHERLNGVRSQVAQVTGHQLVGDVRKYSDAIDALVKAEPDAAVELHKFAASLVNTKPLRKGEVVMLIHAGKLVRGRVEEPPVPQQPIRVSIYHCVWWSGQRYEEGFDTREKEVRSCERVELYHKGEKVTQSISEDTIKAVCGDGSTGAAARCRDPMRPEFLLCLFQDALAAREALEALAAEAEKMDPRINTLVPFLKGMERACVKTQEKYAGKYDQLTDLARMTFNCPSMSVALAVLKFLDAHAYFDIVRIKNRLMRAYDASPTGGYRDMLVNARFQRNKHIVEIQITLSPLLNIKMHGGHAVYKLARLLELNAPETTNMVAMPSKDVIRKIADGLVRNVTFRGVNVDGSMRELLFSKAGLLSPSCAVVSLNFESITTTEAWPVAKVLAPQLLQQIGANLTTLMFNKCGLVGELTNLITRHCPNLEVLDLSRNRGLTGVIPESINRIKKLRELHIWGCSIAGTLPSTLCELGCMEHLQLGDNQITGTIPEAIHKLEMLIAFNVSHNQLTGEIPESIGRCKRMMWLKLGKNKLSGSVPSSIGNLTALRRFKVENNDLSGSVPIALKNLRDLESLDLSGNQNLIVHGVPESRHGTTHFNRRDVCQEFLSILK